MTEQVPRYRLFIEAALSEDVTLDVNEQQAHYLVKVLRLPVGAEIALFNGRDGEWRAAICEIGKKKARLRVLSRLQAQPAERDLWLLFAPVKRIRIDLIVEKATELGVSVLQPVFTEHTVMSRIGEDRLRLISIEAAEQCERLSVPDLRVGKTLASLLAAWPQERHLLMMDETGGGQPIAAAFAGLSAGPAALLVGPEGGFSKSELDAVSRLAFATRVGMGRRILRADTAVIAALACYQAICGDWQGTSL